MVLIKLVKQFLVLEERELLSMLAKNPEIWTRALRRGKHYLRRQTEERRRLQRTREILPGVVRGIAERGGENDGLD